MTGDGAVGIDIAAFDDFLCENIELEIPIASSTPNKTSRQISKAIGVLEDSDDESLFSSDSLDAEEEFALDCHKSYQADGALEQLFSMPSKNSSQPASWEGEPKSMKKKTKTSDRRDSGRRDSSRNTTSKPTRKSLSPHPPSSSRPTRSASTTKKDELSRSEHSSVRPRKSLSPHPPSSSRPTRSASTTKKDELSRSEHSTVRPKLRRNDLYSRSSTTSRPSKSKSESSSKRYSMDTDLARDSAKKMIERRAHYERARKENLEKQKARQQQEGTSNGDPTGDDNNSTAGSGMRRVGSAPKDISSSHQPRRGRNPRRHNSSSSCNRTGKDGSLSDSSRSRSTSRRRHSSSSKNGDLSDSSRSRSASRRRRGSSVARKGPRRNTSGNELSKSSHRGSNKGIGPIAVSTTSTMRRSQSSVDAPGLGSKIRRSQSSVDAQGLNRSSSSTNQKHHGQQKSPRRQKSSTNSSTKSNIDDLVLNLRRESKTGTLSKMNAAWDLSTPLAVDE